MSVSSDAGLAGSLSAEGAEGACAHARTGQALSDSQTRNARKVKSVMGCELRRQLSEPGAGCGCGCAWDSCWSIAAQIAAA